MHPVAPGWYLNYGAGTKVQDGSAGVASCALCIAGVVTGGADRSDRAWKETEKNAINALPDISFQYIIKKFK